MMKPGDRVGVLIDIMQREDGGMVARFLGYGTYVGDEIPDADARGFCEDLRGAGEKNPRIELDSGDVCWGGEVWFGDEQAVMAQMAKVDDVVEITIAEARAKPGPIVSEN